MCLPQLAHPRALPMQDSKHAAVITLRVFPSRLINFSGYGLSTILASSKYRIDDSQVRRLAASRPAVPIFGDRNGDTRFQRIGKASERIQVFVVEPKAFVSQLLASLMLLPDLSVHLG